MGKERTEEKMALVDFEKRRKEIEQRLMEVQMEKERRIRNGKPNPKIIPMLAGSDPESDDDDVVVSEVAKDNEDILKIWGHWREIARLAAVGYKQQEICKILNLSTSCVWTALNRNPLVREQILLLQGKRDITATDVQKRVKAMQPLAIEVLEQDLLRHPTSLGEKRLRNDTAKYVSAMGGNGPVQKQLHGHAFFTKDDLDEINKRAEEIRKGKLKVEELEEIEYEEASS